MTTNPILIQSLADDHRSDVQRSLRRSRSIRQRTAGQPHELPVRRVDGTRTRAGWLLIDLGLHLVMPERRASNRVSTH